MRMTEMLVARIISDAVFQPATQRVKQIVGGRRLTLRFGASAIRGVVAFLVLVVSLGFGSGVARAQSDCTGMNPLRPILFVHGIFEDAPAWATGGSGGIRGSVAEQLAQNGYANTQDYDLYFDGTNVRWSQSTSTTTDEDPIASPGTIPCDARIFSIRYFGWTGTTSISANFTPATVANISVISKAYELSQVIKAVTAATFVKDVILVAHSLGALDSRVYIENLGSSEKNGCSSTSCVVQATPEPYTDDVALLVTLDGVNTGANDAYLSFLEGFFTAVPTNETELEPTSAIIQAVNYRAAYNDANHASVVATDPPGNIVAIINEYRDFSAWCVNSFSWGCSSDEVVVSDSQSIVSSLGSHADSNDIDMPNGLPYNSYLTTDTTISGNSDCLFSFDGIAWDNRTLHLLPCLADSHPSQDYAPADLVFESLLPSISGQYTQVNIQTFDSTGAPYTGAISLTLAGPTGTQLPMLGPTDNDRLTGAGVAYDPVQSCLRFWWTIRRRRANDHRY